MIKIVTSWQTLFAYAAEVGKARIAFERNPSSDNEKALNEAIAMHDSYVDMCMKADEMIGINLNDLS